jgi:hypothetical protein
MTMHEIAAARRAARLQGTLPNDTPAKPVSAKISDWWDKKLRTAQDVSEYRAHLAEQRKADGYKW